jgi:hypothetical protein
MRIRILSSHPLVTAALASLVGLGSACGKSPEPTPPPTAADVAPAAVADTSAANPPADVQAAPVVIARFKGREVLASEVEQRVALVHTTGTPLEYVTVRDALDDLIDETLLASEARAAGFKAPEALPSGVTADGALAQTWAVSKFTEAAKASVGDAELTAWFAERRGLARIVVRSAEQARDVHASLEAAIKADPASARQTFLAIKQKVGAKGETVPDGVLVDAEGRDELGEALVPPEVSKALFALTENGQISEPVAVGESFIIVQRVGLRPATPLTGVPENERGAALDKIVAARALAASEEHLARLRKEAGVEIAQPALEALATRLGAEKPSKLKRLPYGARKLVMQKLRNGVEMRSPALVPPGAHAVEKATYDRIKDKMQPSEPKDSTGGQP